jgi:hypothetical protein
MENLQFYWLAEFKDNSYIMQFEQDQEHSFQEVKDRFSELKYFVLYDKVNVLKRFIVDLEKGALYFSTEALLFDSEIQSKNNIRLIYFRRIRKEIGLQDLSEKSATIRYFLGFQYNDNQVNNRKFLLQIDSYGNWSLGD